MFTDTKIKAKDLKGYGLYYDDRKKRTVYSDLFMKNGYVISNDDVRAFSLFQMRYILVVVITLLIANLIQNDVITVAIGICLLILSELLFRFWFLPSLQKVVSFNKPGKENVIVKTSSLSYSALILTVIISFAFAVWYFLYAKNTNYTAIVKILNYLVVCIPVYLGGLHLVSLIYKLKNRS